MDHELVIVKVSFNALGDWAFGANNNILIDQSTLGQYHAIGQCEVGQLHIIYKNAYSVSHSQQGLQRA